jgi:hypothetical protein
MASKLPKDLRKFTQLGVAELVTAEDEDNPLVATIKKNFEYLLNNSQIKQFHPDMKKIVKFIGSNGGSSLKMATACGLPFAIFEAWTNPDHEDYKVDFARAVQVAEQLAIVYHEELGDAASHGLIPKHSSPTYQFRMKNQFMSKYREVFTVKNEVELKTTLDPVKAADMYKKFLKDSENGKTS